MSEGKFELIAEPVVVADSVAAWPEGFTGAAGFDLRCADCMDLMREFPDKHFDLAIVDPPYGLDVGNTPMSSKWASSRLEKKDWDEKAPGPDYFRELFRVSREQIIWGGNYFGLQPSRCFIVWDKGAGFKNRSFAECEMAWASIDKNAAIFQRDPLACGDYVGKFHPTTKPVALYRWLLENYAKPGQRILDTHLGSGSHAIAAHYFGAHLTACEIDADYFAGAMARIKRETSQLTLFP